MPNFKANRSFTQKSAHSNNAVCTALNSQKSKAIDEANAHGISTEFAKKYSIHRATLYRWAKSQVEVKAARLTKTFAVDTRRGPSIKYPELEKRMGDRYEKQSVMVDASSHDCSLREETAQPWSTCGVLDSATGSPYVASLTEALSIPQI
ncbi:hypothetical protein F441_07900 [Phytophthora nicotianae CJ01A1]|uniref:HTH psq-type domain-containing protein n=5 Tax=Phytophthora nicotianae TaxID=4792 RepID=W2QD64_PHYN3|nr:hypothetical protein PPTG_10902 [Phytophthora nicotianae INRA-310]ETK87890.1 hypothetical protein L915_07757 [Phytophthora nicotianae]ETO76680.1 hypothetical protein F444_07973 [Phytophthora nicotianae P1976]ETP17761.1 hypothetical protein F441_07900 [Phytophthora nicotianae CJ01A1]ETL41309.1 hypothetical protein L916_07686 [Phytophthora nicotianae]ETM47653.1 hypothetical protein L914_07650 [Phytophthora nicotianae]